MYAVVLSLLTFGSPLYMLRLAKVGQNDVGTFVLLLDQIKVFVAEFDVAQIRLSPLQCKRI